MTYALELEITHRCNKNCTACSHRIGSSGFDDLTWYEYNLIHLYILKSKIDSVRIGGGEPLLHLFFQELIVKLREDYSKNIRVWTNGLLLDTIPIGLFQKLQFRLSVYPGWNDEVVEKYGKYDNVTLMQCGEFWDPDKDPNLNEEQAKDAFSKCETKGLRIIGKKLFGCCLADGVERKFLKEPVHKEISENWEEDWKNLETWKACQHCFRAGHITKYDTIYAPRDFSHDHK